MSQRRLPAAALAIAATLAIAAAVAGCSEDTVAPMEGETFQADVLALTATDSAATGLFSDHALLHWVRCCPTDSLVKFQRYIVGTARIFIPIGLRGGCDTSLVYICDALPVNVDIGSPSSNTPHIWVPRPYKADTLQVTVLPFEPTDTSDLVTHRFRVRSSTTFLPAADVVVSAFAASAPGTPVARDTTDAAGLATLIFTADRAGETFRLSAGNLVSITTTQQGGRSYHSDVRVGP